MKRAKRMPLPSAALRYRGGWKIIGRISEQLGTVTLATGSQPVDLEMIRKAKELLERQEVPLGRRDFLGWVPMDDHTPDDPKFVRVFL